VKKHFFLNKGAGMNWMLKTCRILGAGLAALAGSAAPLLAYNNFEAAETVIGQADMTSHLANQGHPVSGQTLSSPVCVIRLGAKYLVSDRRNNRVLIYNQLPGNNAVADLVIGQPDMQQNAPNQNTTPTASTLAGPVGLCTDGGKLMVADLENNRVLIYNSLPLANNAAADVVVGQLNMTCNGVNQGGAPGPNTLNCPHGVATDGQHLAVTDFWNHRVLIFNTIPTVNNASADVVVGQTDMFYHQPNQGGYDGNADAHTLYHPASAAIDSGRLFIVDYWNNRVLIYNTVPAVNNAAADIVMGQPDMNSATANEGGTTTANSLNGPGGVAVSQGRMFITDNSNARLLIFNRIPAVNNAPADVVIGQPDMITSASRPTDANSLSDPFFPFVDGPRLFLPEAGNNRVLIFPEIPPTPNPFPLTSSAFFQILRAVAKIPQGGNIYLRVQVPVSTRCTITAYDITGRKVAVIFNDTVSGVKDIVWEGTGLGSGMYLVCAEAGNLKGRGKVVLVR
jgi:hypothetical protein